MTREQLVLIWVIGRLDKCRETGILGGGNYRLSTAAKPDYDHLEEIQFLPTLKEVKVALDAMEVPEDQHKWLIDLVMPSF